MSMSGLMGATIMYIVWRRCRFLFSSSRAFGCRFGVRVMACDGAGEMYGKSVVRVSFLS